MAKYLDYAGLGLYDRLIKELINNNQIEVVNKINDILGGSDADINLKDLADALGTPAADGKVATGVYAVIDALDAKHDEDIEVIRDLIAEITGANSDSIASIGELKRDLDGLKDAIEALNGEGEGSIDNKIDTKVDQAVADLIDGAPETLDTLREVADWIENAGGSEVFDLVSDVAENAAAIENNTAAIAENATAIETNAAAIEAVKADVEAAVQDASEAYRVADSRLDDIEELLGVSGSEPAEGGSVIERIDSIEDRLDAIREEEDEAIPDADINALFV